MSRIIVIFLLIPILVELGILEITPKETSHLQANFFFENDTIPPNFINIPTSQELACDSSNIEDLSQWYNNAAGAIATDNNPGVTVRALTTLNQLIKEYELSQNGLCGNTGLAEVGFYAIDTVGNTSLDTLYAQFMSIDKKRPMVLSPAASINTICDSTITLKLQQWLDEAGGAILKDDCSDTVEWYNYIWVDNFGNAGSGIPGTGPYIPIKTDACSWSVTVSFLARDQCNNNQVTSASFSFIDTIAPVFLSAPENLSISCETLLPENTLLAYDNCEGLIVPDFEEESTQSNNPEECTYYNYTIIRKWKATDGCDQSVEYSQEIEIVDTTTPIFIPPPDLTLNCPTSIDTSITGPPITGGDNCDKNLNIQYSDNEQQINCTRVITRFWQISDACGSSVITPQSITIIDTTAPQIIQAPTDLQISCSDFKNIDSLFQEWISLAGFAEFQESCSKTNIFAAIPGSFNISDPNSFPGSPAFQLDPLICPSGDSHIIQAKEVEFVFYDDCNNAVSRLAKFSLIDSIAPVISASSIHDTVYLNRDSCLYSISLSFPPVTDDCERFSGVNMQISINSKMSSFSRELSNLDTFFTPGEFEISYIATDCAGNQSVYSTLLTVLDEEAPRITCPPNQTIGIDSFNCLAQYPFSLDILVEDNCQTGSSSIFRVPETDEAALLKYSLRQELGVYVANNQTFKFSGLNKQLIDKDIPLRIELRAELTDSNDYFTILGEDGTELGKTISISENSCHISKYFNFSIPRESYDLWVEDGELSISAISNLENIENSLGINPCSDIDLNNQTDGNSMIFAEISLENTIVSYNISGSTSLSGQQYRQGMEQPVFSLNPGESLITYVVGDLSGNLDSCSYVVNAIDDLPPILNCRNDSILIKFSEDLYLSSELNLITNFSDNCGKLDLHFNPDTLLCAEIQDTIKIDILASDEQGNETSCSSRIFAQVQDLSPGFLSGNCLGDTLFLRSNLSSQEKEMISTVSWIGPNGYQSEDLDPIIPNSDSSFSGTYLLQITGKNGCTAMGETSVEILEVPAPVLITESPIYCVDEEFEIKVKDFVGVATFHWYKGTSPDGILIDTTVVPSLRSTAESGINSFYVKIVSDQCESPYSESIDITSIDKPEAQTQDLFLTLCEGDSLHLGVVNPDSTFSYRWTGPNNFNSTRAFPIPIPSISIQNQGVYELKASAGLCESEVATTQVVVFERPVKPKISGENIYCTGNFILLNVANVFTAIEYRWYKDGEIFTVKNNNTLVIPNASSEFNGDWKVVVFDGLCTSDSSANFPILVEEEINIGTSSNTPVCTTDSIELVSTGIPNAIYSWEGPGGFISAEQNPRASPVAGEYRLTVTLPSGCTKSSSTQIEVLEQPQITALSNSAPLCTDGSIDVNLVPSVFPRDEYTYDWIGPNNFTSVDSIAIIPSLTSEDNGSYSLQISNDACVSDRTNTVIQVTDVPKAVIIEAQQNICPGDDLLIQIASDLDKVFIYQWFTPKGQFQTIDPEFIISNSSLDDSGIYSVSIMDGECISDKSNEISISISDSPPSPTPSFSGPVCNGELLQLFATAIAGAQYEWRGPNDFTANSRNPIIFNVSDFYEGEYAVRSHIGGCISEWSQSIQVNILDIPSRPIIGNDNLRICENSEEETVLCLDENTLTTGAIYIWYNSKNEKIGESLSPCFVLEETQLLEKGRNEVYSIAQVGQCTSDPSNIISIFVDTLIQNPGTAGIDQSICEPGTYMLNAEVKEGLNVNWISQGTSIVEEPTNVNSIITGLLPGINSFILELEQINCHSIFQDTVHYFLEEKPVLNEDLIQGEYNSTLEIDPFENDILPDSYVSTVIKEPEKLDYSINLDGKFIFQAETGFLGTDYLIYEVCNEFCPELCDKTMIQIEVGNVSDCFAPSIITPNRDGINDKFIIPCLESGQYTKNKLIIFNQWGNEVYNASPYRNNWSGDYKGSTLPAGTYFYILSLGDGSSSLNGFLVLEQ